MTLSFADKVAFLGSPDAYPRRPASVALVETHMSCVFLAGDRALKIKKPVRFPFLDFTTLAAREADCREEVRLNRRLAPHVYLGVLPLVAGPLGHLQLGGAGTVVDWVVEMRRLDAEAMLDRRLASGTVSEHDIDRLATTLAGFYARADRPGISADDWLARLRARHAQDREALTRPGFGIDGERVRRVSDRLDAALEASSGIVAARIAGGRFVEGHGDLRPEHVCLDEPVVIFDCLEFDRDMRILDPFEELAFLGMECAVQGFPELGPALARRVAERLDDTPPPLLLAFYAASRAMLRARLTLAHLFDGDVRHPERWEPRAEAYLAFADETLAAVRHGRRSGER